MFLTLVKTTFFIPVKDHFFNNQEKPHFHTDENHIPNNGEKPVSILKKTHILNTRDNINVQHWWKTTFSTLVKIKMFILVINHVSTLKNNRIPHTGEKLIYFTGKKQHLLHEIKTSVSILEEKHIFHTGEKLHFPHWWKTTSLTLTNNHISQTGKNSHFQNWRKTAFLMVEKKRISNTCGKLHFQRGRKTTAPIL